MDPEFTPGRGPQPEDRQRLMAEDFGLEGRRFLEQNESLETVRALSQLLTEELHARFVSTDGVKGLHPAISEEMAQAEAYTLSKQLLWQKVGGMLDQSRPISMSDMDQVFRGTAMATREAFVTICLGLDLGVSAVLEEARARGWRSDLMG